MLSAWVFRGLVPTAPRRDNRKYFLFPCNGVLNYILGRVFGLIERSHAASARLADDAATKSVAQQVHPSA